MTAPAQTLSAEEVIARCAIYDRFIRDKRFHHAYLLDFKRPKGSFDFVTSVAWRKLLPMDDDVHGYGCRSAGYSNASKSEPPIPLKGKAHYVGFYELSVKDGEDEANDIYGVHIEQVIENNEDAHCHIVLTERANLTKDQVKLKGARRSDIFLGIWSKMTGPTRHVCACDRDYSDELSKIQLSAPGTPDEEPEDASPLNLL